MIAKIKVDNVSLFCFIFIAPMITNILQGFQNWCQHLQSRRQLFIIESQFWLDHMFGHLSFCIQSLHIFIFFIMMNTLEVVNGLLYISAQSSLSIYYFGLCLFGMLKLIHYLTLQRYAFLFFFF